MSTSPVLSIILPCYNVVETLSRALDSILMQQVDFHYEILIVNDCSTDGTLEMSRVYADTNECISLILHEENMGNARSFYDGLCAAQGDYFCVLDGDDYYTHREKLQQQINFFRTDVLHEYVATAHHYVYDLGDGKIKIDARSQKTEFTYVDFLTNSMGGYYHTSTYMYRNIFKGNIPGSFKDERFRGDSPRTALHLQASRGKVKVLDFVGSAYVYNYKGIWSGLNRLQQKERQIRMLKDLKSLTDTEYEKRCYDKRILDTEKKWEATTQCREYLTMSIDYYLEKLVKCTRVLAFQQRDFIFKAIYYSQYIDSLCATLGYVNRIYHPECTQKTVNENRLAIIIPLLTPQGGGVFREIVELIEIYDNKEIMILLTDVEDEGVYKQACKILAVYKNVTIKAVPVGTSEKLVWLTRIMANFAPYKAYYYASHFSPYVQAIVQSGLSKNVCLFSFDHGYVCGLFNPSLDCIIAKRPMDYSMLRRHLGKKAAYIPTWNLGPRDCEGMQYQPFIGHTHLITASGAARFYKFKENSQFAYLDFVIELLNTTKGKHYHFGPIPVEELRYIQDCLSKYALPQESFIQIEWSENMLKDMLANHVDIFLEPFPVVSYKMTLEVLAGGIPVFAQENTKRMSKVDFIYPGNLTWKTKRDFIDTLTTLTTEQLEEHSRLSLKYFNSTHTIEVVRPYLLHEKSFPLSHIVEAIDGTLIEIRPYEKIFTNNGSLDLLGHKLSSGGQLTMNTHQNQKTKDHMNRGQKAKESLNKKKQKAKKPLNMRRKIKDRLKRFVRKSKILTAVAYPPYKFYKFVRSKSR